MLEGHNDHEIREALSKQIPNVDLDKVLSAVQRLFENAGSNRNIRGTLGWCEKTSRDIFRKMLEVGDYEGALRAVKQVASLGKAIEEINAVEV